MDTLQILGLVVQEAAAMRQIVDLLPWSASLSRMEFAEMLRELRSASADWIENNDTARFAQILGDWQATVESLGNRGLSKQLADPDRTYVRWE